MKTSLTGHSNSPNALPNCAGEFAQDLKLAGVCLGKKCSRRSWLLLEANVLYAIATKNTHAKTTPCRLTTLKNRHVKVKGAAGTCFDSPGGKSGRQHEVDVTGIAGLRKSLRNARTYPVRIYSVLDVVGEVTDVTSQDVNDYLAKMQVKILPQKDFRTWGGTVLAAIALR